MTLTAAQIWRRYVTDGVPGSGANTPDKTQISAWGTYIESLLTGSAAGLGYASLGEMNADLAHDAKTVASVFNDPTPANNGLYVKSGASGAGAWSRIGDLPNGIIRLTVTGGTGDAIVATAPETPSVPGSKLYLMTPTANNTTTTGIVVNGAPSAPIKNNFGLDLAANSLVNASQVLMAWSVDHYQLLISAQVDASSILASSLTNANNAAASATAAASSASALANQVHQYDTRALAAAATIPTGVQAIKITRFATGYPLAYATYVPGTVAGPMAFAEAGGHYWELDLTGGEANVLWFGAKRDGSTDDAPKIRATMAAVNAIGGGGVYIPAGTYLLGTCAVLNFIIAYSNITLFGDGDGTILKVANAMNPVPGQTWGFAIVSVVNSTDVISNFQLRDIKVDMNGANNTGHVYQNPLIEIDYGNNIVVENCSVINHPGSQIIVLGAAGEPPHMTQALVRGNRFNNVGIAVNPQNVDHSSIFVCADNYMVTDNIGINPGFVAPLEGIGSFDGNTLIECHGTNWVASHNSCDNYTRLGNIAADTSNCINGQFVHNTGRGLRAGIVGFSGVGFSMDQIIVADNTLRLLSLDLLAAIDFTVSVSTGAFLGSLDIHDNNIWSVQADNDASGIYAGISAAVFEEINIERNKMRRLSGPGIEIGSLTATASLGITDNSVIDCGRTSNATYKKGIKVLTASTPKSIKIGRNTIVNTGTVYMTLGINVNLTSVGSGSKIYEDDVIVNVTTPYTISASGATLGPGL